MKVPDFGTDTTNPDLRGSDMIPGNLGPEEVLGLRGSTRDAGRWRGEMPSKAQLLMAAAIMQKQRAGNG